MKQCGLRKAFSDGGLIGYSPTAGEQRMLNPLDERMGWGAAPVAAPAPAATMQHPDADDTGTLPGQAGYNQNGANATSNKLSGMFDKLGGGTASQRFGAGQAIGAMLHKNPRLMSSDDLIDRMGGLSTRSARTGLGQALSGQLMRGYARGGAVDGKGYIHGEKGVDKVPAKVAETGEDILVSHGERIVNKKQNAALERLAAEAGMSLDEYLERSTGEPVGPQMKQGLRGLNKGGFVDDFGNLREPSKFQSGPNRAVLHQQIANATADAQAAPTGQTVNRTLIPTPAQTEPPVQTAQRVNQPSRAPFGAPEPVAGPSQTPAGADPTRMQKAKALGFRGMQGLNAVGALAAGAYDIGTANEPAEQVMGALKASGALPGVAGLPGKVALYGDMALAPFGTSGTKLLDKAARLVGGDDYMLDKNREWGTAGTRAEASQPNAAPVTKPTTAAAGENFDSVDRRAAQERQAAGAQAGLEAKGLRNAMQFLGGEEAVVPEGMRFSSQTESNAPLSTWNSKQDAAAKSIDNRITPENHTGVMSVKQKDGSFKNVAIGQSEYIGADGKATNDWSKTQQYADGVARANQDKAQLRQIQRERAEFAAFNPSITDPAARDAGLRAVSKYMVEDQMGQKAASDKAKLGLEAAKFNQEERKISNLQGNSERDHRYKVETDDDKRLDDVLKSRATVDGKLDGKKYADYQRFVGNFKANGAGENGKHRAKDILDAMEVWEAYGEDDGSIFRRISGQGSDMPTGLGKSPGLLWGENYVDPRTGRQISGTRVSEMSPGARAIFEQNRKN